MIHEKIKNTHFYAAERNHSSISDADLQIKGVNQEDRQLIPHLRSATSNPELLALKKLQEYFLKPKNLSR